MAVLYRSSDKAVCSAQYHLVWCPKYRCAGRGGRSAANKEQNGAAT